MRIIDLLTEECVEVKSFQTPEAFIFLYEQEKFLIIRHKHLQIWSSSGKFLHDFEGEELASKVQFNPDDPPQYILNVSPSKDMLLCYCEEEDIVGDVKPKINVINLKNDCLIGSLSPSEEAGFGSLEYEV